jgi:hypothetical protein
MKVDPTIVQPTLLCLILSLCFHKAKNPPPPYLFNSSLERFHGNIPSTSWHLPTPVPLVNVIGRSKAAFLWNTTPSSSFPSQENSTTTNSTSEEVYKFFNGISPIVAVSNASTWNISEAGLFNATTILITTSLPSGSITSPDATITLISAIDFFSQSFARLYNNVYNNTTTLQHEKIKSVVPLPKASLLTSILSYFYHHPMMSSKPSSHDRNKGDSSASSWYLFAPIPLADLPWNSLPNLHSSTITATAEFRNISTTATSNCTDTKNSHTTLIGGSDSIYPVMAISNASSWNMNETDIHAASTIPTVISLPCSTITGHAASIAFQDIQVLISSSLLLPHVVFSKFGITSLEAETYSSSDSSLSLTCHADIVTHTTHNISLNHEYFDLLASAMFYNAFLLNCFFFSFSIYFIFHF